MKKSFLLILIFCSACGDKTKPLEIENTNQAQSVMDSDTASDNKNSLAVKKKPDPSTLALQELANSRLVARWVKCEIFDKLYLNLEHELFRKKPHYFA